MYITDREIARIQPAVSLTPSEGTNKMLVKRIFIFLLGLSLLVRLLQNAERNLFKLMAHSNNKEIVFNKD